MLYWIIFSLIKVNNTLRLLAIRQFCFISVWFMFCCSLVARWCQTSFFVTSVKCTCKIKTWDCNFSVIHCCSSQQYSSFQLLSFQEWRLKRLSSSGSNGQKAKMPCSKAGQETMLGWSWSWSSTPCRGQRNPHLCAGWTYIIQQGANWKRFLVLQRGFISSGLTVLRFCSCHTWAMNVDQVGA